MVGLIICFCFCLLAGQKMSVMKDAHSHISSLSYITPFTPLHTQVSGNPSIFSTCTFFMHWPKNAIRISLLRCVDVHTRWALAGPGLHARSGEAELEGLLATRTASSASRASPRLAGRHTLQSVPLPATVQPTLVRLTGRKWLDVNSIHEINT